LRRASSGAQAIDADLAAACLFEIGDDPQKRGLAAAGRADERDELALADREIDVGQRIDRAIGCLEGEGQIADVDHAARQPIAPARRVCGAIQRCVTHARPSFKPVSPRCPARAGNAVV
jgi:hypothetical protein